MDKSVQQRSAWQPSQARQDRSFSVLHLLWPQPFAEAYSAPQAARRPLLHLLQHLALSQPLKRLPQRLKHNCAHWSSISRFLHRSHFGLASLNHCEKSGCKNSSSRLTNSEQPLRPLQRLRLLQQYQRHHLLLPDLLVLLWARRWPLKCRLRHLVLLLQFRQAMWARF